MDPALIVLGVVAAGALAIAVWLFVGRATLSARLSAEVEAAQAGARRAEDERRRDEERHAAEMREAGALAGELRRQIDAQQEREAELRSEHARLQAQHAAALERFDLEFNTLQSKVEEQRKAQESKFEDQRKAHERLLEERERKLRELDERMSGTFRALASDALSKSNTEFLKLAEERLRTQQTQASAELEKRKQSVEELVRPIAETLRRTDEKLAEIDKSRAESAAAIGEQLRSMTTASASLRDETGKLAKALREPHVRGRYGEIQLRRVAELAGMTSYCDFAEQDQTRDADGNAARPDMIVRMPNERTIVIDAKTNIQAYLEAINATTPEEAETQLDRFARHVADQATALGGKRYWSRYEGSPEFVVMFIPGDQFIDAALSRRADLIDKAAQQGVLLASPSTLIGLLRAVAVGYQEQRLATAAEELRRLGKEFHERAAVAYAHIARIGRGLSMAVDGFNDFAGSYEKRLLPTLRKFEEEGAKSAKDVPEFPEVVVRPRGGAGGELGIDRPSQMMLGAGAIGESDEDSTSRHRGTEKRKSD